MSSLHGQAVPSVIVDRSESEATRPGRWGALRSPSLRLVLTAGVVSQVGDWALSVGLVYFVYLLTGSTLATGAALLTAVVPQALVGSVAGVYVDRWSRRRTMIATNLLLAAGLVPLLFVHAVGEIGVVYAVLGFESAVGAFFPPAEGALIPEIVPAELLLQANSMYGSGRQLARLSGAGIGGILVGVYGLVGVAWLDLGSFVVAAAVLLPVVEQYRVPRPPRGTSRTLSALRRLRAEWLGGVAATRTARTAMILLVLSATVYFGEGVFGTLAAPFVVAVLHGSGPDYGWFLSLEAVGGILGGALVASRARQWRAHRVLPIASVTFGMLDLLLFNYPYWDPQIGWAFLIVVAVGFPAAGFGAAYASLQQTAVGPEFRGRYLSFVQTVALLTMASGALLASFLGNTVGIVPLLEIQGTVYVVGGLFVGLTRGRERGVPLEGIARLPEAPSPLDSEPSWLLADNGGVRAESGSSPDALPARDDAKAMQGGS